MAAKESSPSNITQAEIVSNENKGKSVDISGGIVELKYFESILQDSVRASVVFADAGNSIDSKTALDGLPIVGTENVSLKFEDLKENKLEFSASKKNSLYVNKVTPMSDDSTKSMVALELASKEYLMNEKVRLNTRYDGKLSDHIKKILEDKNLLATEKTIDIEPTSNNYNFIGNNKKPFYTINWLSMRSVSAENQKPGETAGYFFYETSEGFFFKSIDGLLSQKKKKSYIYNQSPDGERGVPEGYDDKALNYTKDNKVDAQRKLMQGAYSTRIVVFDPFTCYYEVLTPPASEEAKTAGKKLPTLNPELDKAGKNKEYTRTTYMLLDKGTLPTGKTEQQLEKSEEENFKPKDTLNQAIMRYNQLFASGVEMTIAGDFSLHAGDVLFVDAPELQTDTKNDEPNKQSGGLYIIADLCHYISTKGTYTKLNLVRDSFGRKGNHSK